jgi:hypothetical protein
MFLNNLIPSSITNITQPVEKLFQKAHQQERKHEISLVPDGRGATT